MVKTDGKSPIVKRLEHLSLADIAYNVLVETIVNQEYGPGAQISITNLATRLEMSTTPVREALMRAHGEGLVKQKSNHGFVVSDILTPKELFDLFDVRLILETHALEQADILPEVVRQLDHLIAQMQIANDGATYDHFKDYLQLDHEFHRAIVSMSGNTFLVKSWEDLHVHLHLSRLYTGTGLVDRSDSLKEHESVLNALHQSNPTQAMTLLRDHLKQVPLRLQGLLQR